MNKSFIIDVHKKKHSLRIAKASGFLSLSKDINYIFSNGDIISKKGPVFKTSSLIAILSVKNLFSILPFCHQIFIKSCSVDIFFYSFNNIKITCEVLADCETGVEIEALFGVLIASINIYDMLKYISSELTINYVKLEKKIGGKSEYKIK